MTATATKPRKPKNKPAPRVLEVAVRMPSYAGLVDELGIDPAAVLSDYDREREDAVWQPWSLRGAWEIITGRSDWTAWTLGDARALRELTDQPEPIVYDLDAAEWDDAVTHGLQRLGLTYDQLADQAQRGEFSSVEARKLWIAIGGTVPEPQPPAESTSLLGLLDDDLTTVIPTVTETPEETR